MGVFTELPDPGALRGSRGPDRKPIRGNCHIHTPYSFSAFASVEDAFIQAGTEQVRLLGVNDFYTASAYPEFVTLARRYGVVPLLNMEFISLSRPEQERGIRVNDPNNPGRMYVSGKGFRYPFELPGELGRMLSGVRAADRERIGLMVKKTNRLLETAGARFSLSLPELERTIAVEAVRERHIARAIALGLERTVSSDDERRAFLTRLYGGAAAAAPLHDSAALENEIRGKILKSGGSAYVEEDPEAFLPLEDADHRRCRRRAVLSGAARRRERKPHRVRGGRREARRQSARERILHDRAHPDTELARGAFAVREIRL
jgi:hypothetical protein